MSRHMSITHAIDMCTEVCIGMSVHVHTDCRERSIKDVRTTKQCLAVEQHKRSCALTVACPAPQNMCEDRRIDMRMDARDDGHVCIDI